MKIKIRWTLFLMAVLCFSVLMFGCGQSEDEMTVTKTEKDTSEALNVGVSENMSAKQVSVAFVKALATGDFEKAAAFTEAYGDDSFFFAEDIEWYLPRSSLSGILNLGFETFKTKASGEEHEGSAEYIVTLFDASESSGTPAEKTFEIKTVLNDDNLWVVSVPEFYCTNFTFRTAGGNTVVSIDGKEVPKDLCSNKKSGPYKLCKDYTIPFIGKNNVEVTLKNDNYIYSRAVTPNSNNDISSSVYIFKPVDDPEKCFSYVKDSWNALCAKYLVGEIASCVQDYIAKDASYDLCNIVWDCFEAIHIGESSKCGINNENYKLTTCKASNKGNVYWLSDTHVMCYFDYELTWYYNLGKSNQSTHQNSSVILSMENGVYKFYAFPDTGLFMEANNYSNEW